MSTEMDRYQRNAEMWCDLLTAEQRWKAERHAVTTRARLYMAAGLPAERVLDALNINPGEWVARVNDLEAAQAENRAAARRLTEKSES